MRCAALQMRCLTALRESALRCATCCDIYRGTMYAHAPLVELYCEGEGCLGAWGAAPSPEPPCSEQASFTQDAPSLK
eukprot:6071465-Pyramimonas_sp.AAC.1